MEIEAGENDKDSAESESRAPLLESVAAGLDSVFGGIVTSFEDTVKEITPRKEYFTSATNISWQGPYFPAFHNPGWLLRYIVGPHDSKFVESVLSDIGAGITVALTLIPQVICKIIHHSGHDTSLNNAYIAIRRGYRTVRWRISRPSMVYTRPSSHLQHILFSGRPWLSVWVLWPSSVF